MSSLSEHDSDETDAKATQALGIDLLVERVLSRLGEFAEKHLL